MIEFSKIYFHGDEDNVYYFPYKVDKAENRVYYLALDFSRTTKWKNIDANFREQDWDMKKLNMIKDGNNLVKAIFEEI